MTKPIVSSSTLKLATDFYTRRLIELNPVILVTPASLVKLNREVEGLRRGQQRSETNPVWDLPVEVTGDGTSPTRFLVFILQPTE